MKKSNLNDSKNDVLKLILWIVSYISWVGLSINNWISLYWLYDKNYRTVWNIYIYIMGSEEDLEEGEYYAPIQMYYIMNYIVFNFVFAVITIGCIVFFVKTLFQKDPQVIEGMMGKFSQFHFFPLLCAFIMSVIGELGAHAEQSDEFYKGDKAGLAISLVGLISMIFIYIMTDLNINDWLSNFFLKKGTFSCLIILFFYNFCYDVYYVRVADRDGSSGEKDISHWAKGCGMFFSILFGISCIIFSFIFKDIMICFLNLLIYIGMAIYYFLLPEGARNLKENNKNADGIIDIIGLVLSFILFIHLVNDKSKNEEQQIKQMILNVTNAQNQIILKVNCNSEQINLIKSNINSNNNNH